MNPSFYRSIHDRLLRRPALCRAVRVLSKALPGVVYLFYPLMLLYLVLTGSSWLLRSILVPAAGFLLVTVLRAGLDFPRPYEVMDIPPLVTKDTKGKSFPSRHAACAAVIAVTALRVLPALGVFLSVTALLIGLSRVLSGVHFIRDAAAGLLLGAMVGAIGMYALP